MSHSIRREHVTLYVDSAEARRRIPNGETFIVYAVWDEKGRRVTEPDGSLVWYWREDDAIVKVEALGEETHRHGSIILMAGAAR